MDVVKEDDTSGIGLSENPLSDDGGAGSFPIERIEGPEGDAEVKVGGDMQLFLGEGAVGRAKPDRVNATGFFD